MGLFHPDSGTPSLEPPVYADGYTDDFDGVENGTVTVPDGAGLGVTYDWSYIKDNLTRIVVIE